jgi:hypothetical protein
MSVRQPWFGAGLLLYVTSFFLVATGATSPVGRLMGFECAYFAVDLPLTDTPLDLIALSTIAHLYIFLFSSVDLSIPVFWPMRPLQA